MLQIIRRIIFECKEFHTRLFSLYWSFRLRASRLWVHRTGKIIGAKYIHISPYFRAGRLLWLEAIFRYEGRNFSPELEIGQHFACGDLVHIACALRIQIGSNVLLGSSIHITDHNHGDYSSHELQSSPNVPPLLRPLSCSPVFIGSNVFIGDGVVILPGSSIGDGVVIGANSVVNGKLPKNTICVGAPALPIKIFNADEDRWISI